MRRLYSPLLCGLLLCLSATLSSQNLTVTVGNENGTVGQQVCLPVTGRNFSAVTGFQFSVNFDATVLSFVSASGTIGGFPISLVHNPSSPGIIRASWNVFSTSGFTDSGPFNMATLCFTVLKEEETSVVINSNPVPVEFTTEQNILPDNQVTIVSGSVNMGQTGNNPTCSDGVRNGDETGVDCGGSCAPCPTCNDGIRNGNETGVDCGGSCAPCNTGGGGGNDDCGIGSSAFNLCLENVCNVTMGSQTCLDLTVTNFTAVTALQVDLLFPAANLQYVSFTGNSALMDPIIANGATDGEVSLVYFQNSQTGVTLQDGEVFGTVCFTAQSTAATTIALNDLKVNVTSGPLTGPIGNAGSVNDCTTTTPTCSDGIMNGNETGVDCGGSCAPCNTGGGNEVCGMNTDRLSLCLENECNVAQGGQACIDIYAGNFTNVTGFQATLSFAAGNLSNPPTVTTSSALVDPIQVSSPTPGTSRLVYVQSTQSGVTVDDGDVIATICYTNQVSGVTPITFTDLRVVDNNNQPFINPIGNPGSVNGCTTTPTCNDGIMNGDETGVDCGGSSCGPCDDLACGEGTTDVSICIGSECGDAGAEVCVPVFVANFNSLGGFQFRFNYPAANLEYTRIIANNNVGGSFVPGNPSDGTLGIVWTDLSGQGVSYDGAEAVLDICFTVENDAPSPFTFIDGSVLVASETGSRLPAQSSTGGINIDCGGGGGGGGDDTCYDGMMNGDETGLDCGGSCIPCVDYTNITFRATNALGGVGQEVCTDILAYNLDDVAGLQFAISYDPTKLRFNAATATSALPGLQISNPEPGILRVIWFDANVNSNSVPDGTSLLQACFTVLQACETPISIVETPGLSLRVSNPAGESLTPIDRVSGIINHGTTCGGGGTPNNLVLNVGSADADLGTEVCIPVTVTEFTNLTDLTFSLTYDATAVTFSRATNFGDAAINVSNVNSPSPGTVVFSWTSGSGRTIAAGGTLVELCFTVDRLVPTPLTVGNTPTVIQARNGNGQLVGVVPSNGAINPNAETVDGLTFQIGSATAGVGTNVCLPVISYNVDNLIAFQYTIKYDPSLLTYTGAGPNFALNGFNASFINNSEPGVLRVIWNDPQTMGNTLASGTPLYTICFDVLSANPAVISFADNPTAIEFEVETGIVQATLINGVINGGQGPIISNVDVDSPSCSDGDDGSITITASGGSNLTYTWQPNVSTSATATGLNAGTYNVTVTNGAGQLTTREITLTAPSPFSIAVDQNNPVSCNGASDGSITINTVGGTAPYLIDWNGDLPDNQLQQTGLDAGTYSVTVTDANGCAKTISNIQVTESPAIAIAGTVTNIDGDNNGLINVIVSGGTSPFNYVWSGPNNYSAATEDINNVQRTGEYCITVTDANNCDAMQCFTVVNRVNISSFNVVNGCAGQNNGSIDITVQGGDGNYTYRWTHDGDQVATTEDIDGLSPGDYSVTVTSGSETATAVITIDTPDEIANTVVITPAFGGNDGSISLSTSGGNGPYSYSWSNGETTDDISGLSVGQYCVTVTDQIGCTETDCYFITSGELGFAATSTTAAGCGDGQNGQISLSLQNGVGPFVVTVQPTDMTVNTDERTIDFSVPAGTYQITVVDAQGERLSTELTVGTSSSAVVSSDVVSDTEDMGCSGMINLAVTGGTPDYMVSWSNGATGASIEQLCAGPYVATITDAVGCTTVTDTIRIGRLQEELIAITPTACADGNQGAIDITISGGVAPYSFVWTQTDGVDTLATSEDISGLIAGSYTLNVTDASGARLVRNYTVDPSNSFSINVQVTSNYNGFGVSCADATDGQIVISVSGQSEFTYLFTLNDEMVGIDSVLENAAAGTYVVSVLDSVGCEIARAVEITAPTALELTGEATAQSCSNQNDGRVSINVQGGVGPYSYAWSNGASTASIQALGSGEYTVTVTDVNDCEAIEVFEVTAPEDLAVTLESAPATDGCNGSVRILPLGGSGNYSYSWETLSNQGNNPFAEGLCPGDYTVTVTDANGCQSVVMTAKVEDRRFPCLSAREVITPNGDGLNESFVIFCSDGQEASNNNLEVYNRWGQLVFQMADYDCSVDGGMDCFEGRTNDGAILPAGPYYYIFDFQNPLGERMQQRGSLTIIRE